MQVMSGDVSLCHHLQALAASRGTRELLVRRVSQVGGDSRHCMMQDVVLCLGGVIDASDEW